MQWEAVLRAYPAIVCGKIAGGEVGHDLVRAFNVAGGIHAKRREDTVIEEAAERFAGDLFDDTAEQHEIGVAVQVARAGGEIQAALAANPLEQILWFAGLAQVHTA